MGSRRAALVTGAAKRLGRRMAVELARRGYDVAIHYASSPEDAEATAQLVREEGQRAALVQADLGEKEAPGRTMAEAMAALGPLTVLVNNASSFTRDRLATLTGEAFDRQHAINLRAPAFLCQAFVAALPEGEEGLIVNMVDARVHNLTADYLSYSISKMGLWALTQVLARDLAPRVRVNAIGPGLALPAPGWSDERFERFCREMPLERGTSPDEIASALSFILHTASMTGQMITLDGGQQMGWLTPGQRFDRSSAR